MDILVLNGSPRVGGNTDRLLDAFGAGVKDSSRSLEIINLRELKISPCNECLACYKNGECVIHDDMTPLYDKLSHPGVVVLASPIFFYGVTAWAKAAIDRTQALWARKYILKTPPVKTGAADRKGFFISVGGTKGAKMFDGAILTAKYFFDAINVTYDGEFLVRQIDTPADLLAKPDILAAAYEEGIKMAKIRRPEKV